MMGLSMKAAEAVGVVGRESLRTSFVEMTRSQQRSPVSNDDKSRPCHPGRCKPWLPNSKFRVSWDLAGMFLIVCDAFLLPVVIAWDLDITPFLGDNSVAARLLQMFSIISMCFWPLDILLNFNTSFYVKGTLQKARWAIAKRYMTTWLAFDICVVALDLSAGMTAGGESANSGADFLQPLRSARYLRILRTLRLLRILKAGKINVLLENLVISMGRQWLILAFTVGKMLLAIGAVAHILACAWFGLGASLSDGSRLSWIDLAGIKDLPPAIQYAHSIGWILLPPAPPPVRPESGLEQVGCLVCVVTTVLVIGSALSILTGTLNEIRQVNSERSRKRRELRIYLQTKAVRTELLMRIMSYADYKMARHSPISFDAGLISPMLEAELATAQLGDTLQGHPFFALTGRVFPQVFADFCRALEKKFFCEAESVFSAGLLAEMMYITSHGQFSLCSATDSSHLEFEDECRYFAEVALYVEAVMHHFSLRTESFAEVFALSGSKMAAVLANSPMCATMFIEYTNEYLLHYTLPAPNLSCVEVLEQQSNCAQRSCESNSFYLELYVDSRRVIRTLDLNYLKVDDLLSPPSFVDHVLRSKEPETLDETVKHLRAAFVELHPEEGLHIRYSDSKEQERAESGILSLIALVRDDYTLYVSPQKPTACLSSEQWQELQELLVWCCPDHKKMLTAIFLLAVKGLGKFRSLTRQLPLDCQRPESAISFILSFYSAAVPSWDELDQEEEELVHGMLQLQLGFNFAQMLQGENVAANLLQLKEKIQNNGGEELLKVYVMYLLGFMSGLAGGTGSRFMTCSNAKTVILGLSMLKNALSEKPAPLYWSYIHHRSVAMQHQPRKPEDLAVARLACLCRAQTHQDYEFLQKAWQELTKVEQADLTRHFLADGITSQAVVCEFLPLCLERAKANAFVRVPVLLEVLVDLLQAVRSASQCRLTSDAAASLVAVDLADLAAFILMVQNSYIFQTCLARAKLRATEKCRFHLDMTQENWRRVSEPQSDVVMLASSVHAMQRRQEHGEHANSQVKALVRCHV
ncbi:unnamed protein product [Effrenium voratum]|nr:unnamed protein product [Effrenium voratum]